MIRLRFTVVLWALLIIVSCTGKTPSNPANHIIGTWRGVLESPGGELPFHFIIKEEPGSSLSAVVRNGEELLPFSSVQLEENHIKMSFNHYDSHIEAHIDPGSKTMKGKWSRRSLHGKRTVMNFSAAKDAAYRFPPVKKPSDGLLVKDINGEWDVTFTDESGTSKATAVFNQKGTRLTGTFLTPVGDYRYLEGTYEKGILALSVFDGAHAFLFTAYTDENGVLFGQFWSRDTYHAAWTGYKGAGKMPDPFELTKITNDQQRFLFRFPDLNGKFVTPGDPRFHNKVLIVYIFGTWCPNCNDEAPFLQELYDEYHDRGLEIVGLANEFTGHYEKDRDMVKRYAKKYGLSWPILIVGIADKKKTAEALADLDRVLAYPTTLFIDRDKKVQKIYTGFSGPATGQKHTEMRRQFKQIIQDLLNQKVPPVKK